MNKIQFNNASNSFQNFNNINNVNMFNYNNNSNTNQSQNNNITGYIPYADNFPTNFFQPNKISIINNSDINNTSQFNSFNNNQSLSNQNNFNPYNNNKINIFNNNNINSPKIETVNKNEETDADLIQGLSGKYIHNKDNSEDNIKSKEILINLGKIVVNDQVLNNFPIINLTNLNKYDIPLTEKMLNNDDFFTAIKENKEEENQMPIEEEDEKKEIIADNYILDIDENDFNNLKEFMNYEERKRYINYKQLMLRKLIEKLYNKSVDIILEIKRNIKNKVKKSKNFELSNSLSNVFKLHNELYNKYLISQNKQPINENKEYYTYIQYFIDNSNGKTYKCEICSKEFINFHKLGGHMSKVHPNCSEKYKKQNDTRKQREGNRKVLDYVKEKLFEKYNLNYRKMKQNDEKDKIKIFIKAHQKEYEILRRKIHREKALKNNEEED